MKMTDKYTNPFNGTIHKMPNICVITAKDLALINGNWVAVPEWFVGKFVTSVDCKVKATN